jgi:hypothetical protein
LGQLLKSPSLTRGYNGVAVGGLTTPLSSREGVVSDESRKRYMPPRSAAADGSALRLPALLFQEVIRRETEFRNRGFEDAILI